MSYILDALKKSSENRARIGIDHGSESSATAGMPERDHATEQRPVVADWLPWFVAIVALLWGSVIALSEQPTVTPSPSLASTVTTQAPTLAPPPTSTPSTPPTALPTPVAPAVVASSNKPPPEVVAAVERLDISAHMYSSRLEDRLMIVDGTSLRQGGKLPNGMMLEEITPTGGVFAHQGHKVRKRVFP